MRSIVVPLLFIGISQTFSHAETTCISLFKTEAPAQSSKFLSPLEGASLGVVTSPMLSAGQCLLRRKLAADEYCLLLGKLTNTNNQEILPINLTSDIPIDTIIRLKFYDNEDSSSMHELSDVFFTKFGTVYVGGTTHISYFYHGNWNTYKADLKAISAQEQLVVEDKAKKRFLWGTLSVLGGLLAVCFIIIIIGVSVSPG